MWAGFNVHLAAGMLLEAASLTTQISGEIIPVRRAGQPRDGRATAGRRRSGHRTVERAGDPGGASDRDAARLRQYSGAEGFSEICPATHGLIIEALQEAGLPKGVVNFVTNAPADAARRRRGA